MVGCPDAAWSSRSSQASCSGPSRPPGCPSIRLSSPIRRSGPRSTAKRSGPRAGNSPSGRERPAHQLAIVVIAGDRVDRRLQPPEPRDQLGPGGSPAVVAEIARDQDRIGRRLERVQMVERTLEAAGGVDLAEGERAFGQKVQVRDLRNQHSSHPFAPFGRSRLWAYGPEFAQIAAKRLAGQPRPAIDGRGR